MRTLVVDIVNRIIKSNTQAYVIHESYFLLLYILIHNTTLYRDLAAGVGLAPLACCLEIFEA